MGGDTPANPGSGKVNTYSGSTSVWDSLCGEEGGMGFWGGGRDMAALNIGVLVVGSWQSAVSRFWQGVNGLEGGATDVAACCKEGSHTVTNSTHKRLSPSPAPDALVY